MLLSNDYLVLSKQKQNYNLNIVLQINYQSKTKICFVNINMINLHFYKKENRKIEERHLKSSHSQLGVSSY